MNTVIIVGSSATYGNTEQLALAVASKTSATVINLSLYEIEQFDYKFNNRHDDFLNLIKKILSFDNIIFASPMYWYAASGIMKAFIDRLSDLKKVEKDLGRQLRGKSAALVATGCDAIPANCFEEAFKLTYQHLGMNYTGMLYCSCEEEIILAEQQGKIDNFVRGLYVK